jgi:VWFA-related protein
MATLSAQAPTAQQSPPTFRAGVQYIEVDVRVTDSKGRFVTELTKDDFVLLDDGKPQTISTATFVNLEVESPVTRRLAGTIEPDIATNAGGGRMWVMLLGGYAQRARLVARRFVEEALGPNDEVAVVLVHGNMSSAQGFTRNRTLMLNSIDRLQSDSPEEFVGDSVVRAYQVLEELCVRLGRVGGRRKAVLFFDPPRFFIPTSARDAARLFAQRDAIRAATRNNVAVYVVATDGLTTELSPPGQAPERSELVGMAGQRFLAEETGGDAIVNSNNFEDGYQRFVRDTNQYYLIGFTPSVEHRDDDFHRLTVRVNRPGLSVHARQGYYGAKSEPVSADSAPEPDAPGLSPDALEALRLPLSVNGLTLDLAAAPFRGTAGNGSVLLSARVRGEALVLAAGELIEIGYRATTTEGKTTPGAFHVIKLDLTDRSREAAKSSGLQFVDWLSLPAGRHQVRFVFHQPNGKTGMVVGDVDVPDFKAAISMSGIVIASSRLSAQPPLKMDEPLRKLLGAHPTAERTFARSDIVTAYAEVYMSARPDAMTATVARAGQLNRSRPVDMTLSPDTGRFGVVARVPVRDLQPGDYVLTLEAKAGRLDVTRQVLFSVTDR